jgi:hypothetical protein
MYRFNQVSAKSNVVKELVEVWEANNKKESPGIRGEKRNDHG